MLMYRKTISIPPGAALHGPFVVVAPYFIDQLLHAVWSAHDAAAARHRRLFIECYGQPLTLLAEGKDLGVLPELWPLEAFLLELPELVRSQLWWLRLLCL